MRVGPEGKSWVRMSEIVGHRLDADAEVKPHRCARMPEGVHAVGALPRDPGRSDRGVPDRRIEVVLVQRPTFPAIEQETVERRTSDLLPRQWFPLHHVREQSGGCPFRHRGNSRLAVLRQRRDWDAAFNTDLLPDVNLTFSEIKILSPEPECLALPQPTCGSDHRDGLVPDRMPINDFEYLVESNDQNLWIGPR